MPSDEIVVLVDDAGEVRKAGSTAVFQRESLSEAFCLLLDTTDGPDLLVVIESSFQGSGE